MPGIRFYTTFSGVYGNLHPIVCSKLHLIEARWYSRELPKIFFLNLIEYDRVSWNDFDSVLLPNNSYPVINDRAGRKRPVSVYGRLIDTKWNSLQHNKGNGKTRWKKRFFPKAPDSDFNFLWCAFIIIPNRLNSISIFGDDLAPFCSNVIKGWIEALSFLMPP